MTHESILSKIMTFIFDRRIFCKIGWHTWKVSLDDYLEEFGTINIANNKICNKAICSNCDIKYKDYR